MLELKSKGESLDAEYILVASPCKFLESIPSSAQLKLTNVSQPTATPTVPSNPGHDGLLQI